MPATSTSISAAKPSRRRSRSTPSSGIQLTWLRAHLAVDDARAARRRATGPWPATGRRPGRTAASPSARQRTGGEQDGEADDQVEEEQDDHGRPPVARPVRRGSCDMSCRTLVGGPGATPRGGRVPDVRLPIVLGALNLGP